MQQHFAENAPLISASNTPAGPRPVLVARRANSYAISVDTRGKLRWPEGDLNGDHLICVVSEQAPENYLAMLRQKGISYTSSDLTSAAGAVAYTILREVGRLPGPKRIRQIFWRNIPFRFRAAGLYYRSPAWIPL